MTDEQQDKPRPLDPENGAADEGLADSLRLEEPELQDEEIETAADAASASEARSVPMTPPVRGVRRPGPGVAEALVWTFALMPVQLAGMFLAVIVVKYDEIQAQGAAAFESISMDEMMGSVATIACIQAAMLFFAVGGAFLRLGGTRTFRRLGEWSISPRHLFIISSALLPVALFCGRLQQWAMHGWEQLLKQRGIAPEELPTFQALEALVDSTPVWQLVVLIGVVPAIAEELIFRGIIGRGLVARRGVVSGVLLTSFLFAMVHLHPAQALGLMPLAIFMHVAYLATRSFLAPMLIHFLNNSFAVLMLSGGVAGGEEAGGIPPAVAAIAFVVLVLAIALLWQTRVHYRWKDGGLCTPGYPTVEPPRPDAPVVRVSPAAHPLLAGAFAFSVVLLFVVLGFAGAMNAGVR